MAEKKRATIRDIAAASGFSKSTVSMALKGEGRIPDKTREIIRKVAQDIGYHPDPKISKLMGHLSQAKKRSGQGTLALVSSVVEAHRIKRDWYFKGFYEHICDRAAHYGYGIDYFRVGEGEDALSPARLIRTLQARGIEGILFLPIGRVEGPLPFDANPFSCVTSARQFSDAEFNRVGPDSYTNTLLALTEAQKLGYRKPALVIRDSKEQADHAQVEAAFLLAWDHGLFEEKIPVYNISENDHEALGTWLKKAQPDLVFSMVDYTLWTILKAGYKVPEEIGFIQLLQSGIGRNIRTHDAFTSDEISGVNILPEQVDASAVDMLVAMINRGEKGIPEHPTHVTLRGEWRDCKTTRKQSSKT